MSYYDFFFCKKGWVINRHTIRFSLKCIISTFDGILGYFLSKTVYLNHVPSKEYFMIRGFVYMFFNYF